MDFNGWILPKIKVFRIKVMLDERHGTYKEYNVQALNEKEARKIVKRELRKEMTVRLNAMRVTPIERVYE